MASGGISRLIPNANKGKDSNKQEHMVLYTCRGNVTFFHKDILVSVKNTQLAIDVYENNEHFNG